MIEEPISEVLVLGGLYSGFRIEEKAGLEDSW